MLIRWELVNIIFEIGINTTGAIDIAISFFL